MPSPSRPDDSLAPLLDDAEAELRRLLHETCVAEAENVSTKSSAEIRKLEDSLLAAAVAAAKTVALRRKLGEKGEGEGEGKGRAREVEQSLLASKSAVDVPATTTVTGVREFHDDSGRAWRAWLVTPGASRTGRNPEHFLGKFNEGWICFETMDSTARRRLPCQRADWADLRDEELERLRQQAISVPERKSSRAAPQRRPDPESGASGTS